MPQILDSEDWSSIQFEEQAMPQSLMALSVIDSDELSEATSEWLWRLTLCVGVLKTGNSAWCRDSANELLRYLPEHRQEVIELIGERLSPHGFDPGKTFGEWVGSLEQIEKISGAMNGECSWMGDLP